MQTLHVPLLEKREIAKDTYQFSFSKPHDFTYTAGQYVSLCVEPPEIAGPNGTMRELSLVSAPYEKELVLALRFRESLAKKQFLQLQSGNLAFIQGPFGTFHLKKNDKRVVFLAGGIGIIPLISMLKQAVYDNSQQEFFVFYSNRREADIAFLSELKTIARQNPKTTLITTLTLEHPDGWTGETGYISSAMLRKYLQNPTDAYYYLAGPQRFVGGMWEILEKLEVPPSHIHGEEFTGY